MPEINNAEALRAWLMGCPAIAGSAFGMDYLGDAAGSWSLGCVPTEAGVRKNILGEAAPRRRQSREYWLDARLPWSADEAGNLENLGRMQAAEDWMTVQSAAGALPDWNGGRVTAVLPSLSTAPVDFGAGTARYRLKLRVEFEREHSTGGYEYV